MKLRMVVAACMFLSILLGIAYAFESQPKPFRQYQGREYGDYPLPPD